MALNIKVALNIKAEDVCAFLWAHADQYQRTVTCALSGVPWNPTVELIWNEISQEHREKIVAAFVYEVAPTTPMDATALPKTDQHNGAETR